MELKTIRAVLLDVNGTLLGYSDPMGFQKRFAQACADTGHPVTVEEVHRAFVALAAKWTDKKAQGMRRASSDDQYRATMTWFYRRLLEEMEIPGDLEQMASALYDRFILREGFMPLFPDVEPALVRLRARGLRLGVLSNFPPHLEDTLRQHGIHGYFDFFVVSSLVGLEKPDPAIFELAIQRAGVPREEILYVGDDLDDDIRGAQAVHLAVLLIDRHDQWQEIGVARIRGLDELPALLDAAEPGYPSGGAAAGPTR